MVTKRSTLIVAAAIAALAGSVRAQAPAPFALEVRGGVALPTQQLGGTDLGTGAGTELTASYRILPALSVYGGWDYAMLDGPVGSFQNLNSTGYAFGARVDGPAVGRITPWLRAGAQVNHIELEDGVNPEYASSDHKLGWEVGAGAALPLVGRFAVTPGIRYRSFAAPMSELGNQHRLSYLTIELGISAAFGGRQ